MTRTVVSLLAAAGFAMADPAVTSNKRALTLDGARRVVESVIAEVEKNHSTGVVAVVDDGGNLMALARTDGTFPAGANISIGKARTAAMFQRPTKVFEDIVAKGRTSMVALNDFTPLQGGVPIVVGDQIVGAVGVSGAASAAQDEEFAKVGAASLSAIGSKREVTFIEKDKVAAGFEKGAVLFDSSDKYMVHASRREGPGLVEVHEQDADIVYVLEGGATLITGGKPLDSKKVGPGEFRAPNLEGGDTRQLAKGDVVIIPAGTPHWFKEVTNPFKYYVVKAR